MPRLAVIVIGASAALVVGIFAVVAFHNQQVHREQTAAAEARFKALDTVHSGVNTMQARFTADFGKMDADSAAAIDAGNKRHDEYYSLSTEALFNLARTERVKVESMQSLQEDIDGLDQSYLQAFASVYGEAAIAQLRQVMTERNEARENALNMWLSAAQGNEDDLKADLNGGNDPSSEDAIAQDYNENAKDETHARQLQLQVNRFSLALGHRLAVDWQQAKQAVATLQGSR